MKSESGYYGPPMKFQILKIAMVGFTPMGRIFGGQAEPGGAHFAGHTGGSSYSTIRTIYSIIC